MGRPAVSRSGIPAGSSAPPALGIAGRPCERALNECGEDCESLGASRLAHFGSVPSSVDERTLKGILLLLACCTQEESSIRVLLVTQYWDSHEKVHRDIA